MSKIAKIYNRTKAVKYAHKWAKKRNPKYFDFEHFGGDCTNYASQCIHAGSRTMNQNAQNGWCYFSMSKKAPAWSQCELLYKFLTTNKGAGPYGREVAADKIVPGDIAQLSFDGATYSITAIIVAVNCHSPEGILIASHTYDCDNRPLSSYICKKIRYIHIEGVR